MCDEKDKYEEKKLSYKEKMKKLRREQYLKAKEKFKNSEYATTMKAKQKDMRREAYKKAKERRKHEPDHIDHPEVVDEPLWQKPKLVEIETRAEKDEALWQKVRPASQIVRPKLHLVKDSDS